MRIVNPEDQHAPKKFSRDELVEIVKNIMDGVGDEEQVCAWIQMFEDNISHPSGADLILVSDQDFDSAEELVDFALSYKPIEL